MRVAWFRQTPPTSDTPLDETALAILEIGQTHEVEIVTPDMLHDFVWRHFRAPHDVCVYELGTPHEGRFLPYSMSYPGVMLVSGATFESRDAPSCRRACAAARVLVARDEAVARRIADQCPGVPVRHVPLGVGLAPHAPAEFGKSARMVRVGIVGPRDTAEGAIQRAREAGARLELVSETGAEAIARAEILIVLSWPGGESVTSVLAGMAARRAVIVFEMETTAGWPALDPQTWQLRGALAVGPPIVVSIDPFDREHSIVATLRRLAADAMFRESLASAAHDWWRGHATLAHAVAGWHDVLQQAAALPPRPTPAVDGTATARAILGEFGVSVDFLP